MKNKKLIAVLSMAAVLGTSSVVLTGCNDPKPPIKLDYDMSSVSLTNITVSYDGTPKTVTVNGVLPEGVTATYKYYKINDDETETLLVNEYPVNVGKYKIVTEFNGDYEKYNNILNLSATLTIVKADVNVVIGANKIKTSAGEETLPQPKQFEAKPNGDLFVEYDGKEYVVDVIDSNVNNENYSITYYKNIKEDGSVDETSQTLNNTLKNAGDTLYVLISTENTNLNANIVKKVTMEQKVIKISNYEDLVSMVEDCNTKDKIQRINYKYELTNNIDCENAVWRTPGTTFGDPTAFCGEFAGNGFTISNLQITNESASTLSDTNGINVGFFGYTVDADIHDVTFKNVNINITTDGYVRQELNGNNVNPVYAGIVVARMECDQSNGGETSLRNITVEDCNISVNAYKAYVGSVIGIDHATIEKAKRENLNVKNVTIFARCLVNNTDRVVVGGIAGETQGGDAIVYNKCNINNLILRCWDGVDMASIPKNPTFMGAVVGRINNSASITIKDCTIVDYAGLAVTQGQAGSYGYWGAATAYPIQSVLHIENSTHSVTEGKENIYYLQSGGGIVDSWIEQN